jgi:CTD kinase subunit beta
MLDLLELYTHHRSSTSVGPGFPLDVFLNIRIPLNQESDARRLPRYAYWKGDKATSNGSQIPNGSKDNANASKQGGQQLVNPLTPTAAHKTGAKMSDRGRESTVRFMLNPEQAKAERDTVAEYFKVEMEEYEVEE